MGSRRKGKSTTEETSTDTGNDEFARLASVCELLLVQERMFKSFIDSIMNSVTKRVDSLVSEVSQLKASLDFSDKGITRE